MEGRHVLPRNAGRVDAGVSSDVVIAHASPELALLRFQDLIKERLETALSVLDEEHRASHCEHRDTEDEACGAERRRDRRAGDLRAERPRTEGPDANCSPPRIRIVVTMTPS